MLDSPMFSCQGQHSSAEHRLRMGVALVKQTQEVERQQEDIGSPQDVKSPGFRQDLGWKGQPESRRILQFFVDLLNLTYSW